MEAVLRTAHFLMTGHELSCLEIKELRGLKGVKFARARIGQRELGVAAVSGLGNARALLEEIRAGRRDIQYIEAMACPGGCIAGGGGPQTRCAAFGGHGANSEGSPAGSPPSGIRSRLATLYRIDRDEPVRTSHANKSVRRLYKEFLGEPLGENSRKFLHTRYDRKEAAK
jgi:iron only hydrogenase large subunit-like protein